MAKLKDVLEGKGSGDYFTTEEVEKKLVIVIEDLTSESEIREHDTGKKYTDGKTGKERKQTYYCVAVNVDSEVKDLHITWTGLTQLAKVMPLTGTWKGQQFVIDAVKTKGKLDITAKGLAASGTYEMKQTTIPAMSQDNGLKPVFDQLIFAARIYPGGIPEQLFDEMLHHQPGTRQKLKDMGMVFENKPGFFMVVM